MFKYLAVFSVAIVMCQAYGGGGYGGGASYGGGGYGGGGYGGGGYGVIPAAIQSRHHVEYYDVPSTGYVKPTTIEVGASHIPINMIFRSASSNLNVKQYHEGAQGSYQESQSEDDAHRLYHTVRKPIYQIVKEVITPYRKITQEVKPVQEDIQTIVARGTKDYGGGYKSMGGGYGGGHMGGGYSQMGY